MDDKVKWLLIAGGAYLIYRQYAANPAVIAGSGGTQAATSSPAVNPSGAGGTVNSSGGGAVAGPGVSSPASPALPASNLTASQLAMLASMNEGQLFQLLRNTPWTLGPGTAVYDPIARTGRLMTVSQWNYFLTLVTGIPGQALGDNGQPIGIADYVALLNNFANTHSSNGMNGLGVIGPHRGAGGKKLLGPVQTFDMQEVGW